MSIAEPVTGRGAVGRWSTRNRRRRGAFSLRNGVGRPLVTLGTILIIVLILLLIGAIPSWPHSRGWGYGPSGILGAALVILVILVLLGTI